MIDWLAGIFKDTLPQILGAVGAAGVLAAIAYFVRRRKKPSTEASASNFCLHEQLLEKKWHQKFEVSGLTASAKDDQPGLALLAELISKKAEDSIKVIGRGSQWEDPKTRDYMRSVAAALARGVQYSRILILDSNLPTNGLVWLLMLERFCSVAKFRGNVSLFPVKVSDSTSRETQYQIIDDKYLHRVRRSYQPGEPGVKTKSYSMFAEAPHPDVGNHVEMFQKDLAGLVGPLSHRDIVREIQSLLTTRDTRQYSVAFHWRVVLETIKFLDGLTDVDLPPTKLRFVGSLMPYTFTYEAAQLFVEDSGEEFGPLVILPFETFEDCIDSYRSGRIKYICLPTRNTTVGGLELSAVAKGVQVGLRECSEIAGKYSIAVNMCFAGRSPDMNSYTAITGVEVSLRQFDSATSTEEETLLSGRSTAHSNYHAAWKASVDDSIVAVTSAPAAEALGLRILRTVEFQGPNTTEFEVLALARKDET